MTGSPRRLKDDPDFRWETGCDLADEGFAVGGYDLPSMRAKVLAQVTPPSGGAPLKVPAAGWSATWFAAAAALVGVGGLAGLWVVAGLSTSDAAPPAPQGPVVEQPSPVVPAPTLPPEAPVAPIDGAVAPVERADAAAPVEVPPTEAPSDAVPVEAPSVPLVAPPPLVDDEDAAADADAAVVEPSAPAAPEVGGAPPSTLEAELAAYDRATAALAGGDAAAARDAFRAYLSAYPQGRLAPEASFGLLGALVSLGDHRAVETLAASLLGEDALQARHGDVLRIRAENLVWLGECDRALELAASLSSRERADVRRACRRR